jgi:Flp pilus assembly protein TadD
MTDRGGERRARQVGVANGSTTLRTALEIIGLAGLALLVYWPALRGEFLWDDTYSVRDNPLMHGLDGLWNTWTTMGRIPKEVHWWPLTYTVLWVEHRLWGWETLGYHLVNVLLHVIVCVQIWRLMRRLKLPGAWLAAALFAAHPVHVETVAWTIELKDLLATALYLLAVECFLIHDAHGRRRWLAAATLLTIAAMLCKSVAVTLPAGLAILIWYRRGRIGWRDLAALAPVAAAALGMGLLDWAVTRHYTPEITSLTPAWPWRVAKAGWALWFYAGKLAWPAGLTILYPQWSVEPAKPAAWLPLAGAGVLAVVLWLARERIGRGPLACWLFYAVTLGPVLGVLHFNFLSIAPAADRYQYLPSVGPLAGVAALSAAWLGRAVGGARLWRVLPPVLALAVLAVLTWRQAALYRLQLTLFSYAAESNPKSAEICINLAVGLTDAGRTEEARLMLEKASSLEPQNTLALGNLAHLLMCQGKEEKAAVIYRRALALDPTDPELLRPLAWILATTPDLSVRNAKEALRLAGRAIAIHVGEDPVYLNTLAAALASNGRMDQAAATERRALQLARERGQFQSATEMEQMLQSYEKGEPPYIKLRMP